MIMEVKYYNPITGEVNDETWVDVDDKVGLKIMENPNNLQLILVEVPGYLIKVWYYQDV